MRATNKRLAAIYAAQYDVRRDFGPERYPDVGGEAAGPSARYCKQIFPVTIKPIWRTAGQGQMSVSGGARTRVPANTMCYNYDH